MKVKKILTAICAAVLLLSIFITAILVSCRSSGDDSDDNEGSSKPKAKDVEVFIAKTDSMPDESSSEWKKPSHSSILSNVDWKEQTTYISYLKIKNNSSHQADFRVTFQDDTKVNALADAIDVYALGYNHSSNLKNKLADLIETDAPIVSGTLQANETVLCSVVFDLPPSGAEDYAKYDKLGTSLYIEIDYQILAPETDIPTLNNGSVNSETRPPYESHPEHSDPYDTDPPIEPPVENFPSHISQKNYDDSFVLAVQTSTTPIEYFQEVGWGTSLDQAIYDRNQLIQDYLGVEVVTTNAGAHDIYATNFMNSVQNRDGAYDALITHPAEHISNLVTGMYLYDISELPGISLNEEYWNLDIMDTININENYYLGYSNINVPTTHVIAFAKKLLKQSNVITETDLYNQVFSGEWTLDQFIWLTQNVSEAISSYGLAAQQWVPWIGFLHSSDMNYVEYSESEGGYQLSIMNDHDKIASLTKSLIKLSASGCCDLTYPVNNKIGYPYSNVIDGSAFMELVPTKNLGDYNSSASLGILPYPLYDSSQYDPESPSLGYRSLQWSGYLAVPSYLDNASKTGETLELMSFASDDVLMSVFEEMLCENFEDLSNDAVTLSIVWNGLCADPGQAYSDGLNVLYYLPQVTWPGDGGYPNYKGRYDQIERNANKTLLAFYKKVAKLSQNN